MSNFPTNYTITEVTYNNVPSGSTVSTLHPTAVLLITPLLGYTLDSTQFSVQYLPPNTTSVVFTQSGLNVVCTVNFNPTFVMPPNNIDIPLCINGMGELAQYTVEGYVYSVGDTHVVSTPGSGIAVPFSVSGGFNSTVSVYTGILTCDPGYYMPVPPVVTQIAGSSTNFTIAYNDTYNGPDLIIREYTITYVVPNGNSAGNDFSITAVSAPIYVPVVGITNYSVDTSLIAAGGDVRTITLIGSVGAAWTLTCVDPIISGAGGVTVTTLSGVIGSNGTIDVTLIFPAETVDTTYSLLLSGTLVSPFPSANPIVFSQLMDITVTYTTSPNTYFINNGNKYNSGAPYIFTSSGMDGYSNNFNWNISPVNDYGMVLVGAASPNDFSNTQQTTNGGTSFIPATISAIQTSSTLIELNIINGIIQYGSLSFTSTLDLSKFIAYIDTTIPSAITAFTATSGGIVSYTGTSGTLGYKGICYGINPLPTIADSVIQNTTGFGSFTSNMTQLIASTVYYVRAYGYNSSGIVFYGPEKTFTTGPEFPLTCTVGWDTTNLNVTTYRDGTAIPNVTTPTAWAALTTGAWRSVNDNPANDAVYGKLYNGYAVAGIYDAASLANPALRKKLAPAGRAIPESTDVIALIDCLGGPSQAGGKMKEVGTTHWNSPNVDATNSSNFTSLPAGFMSPYQNSFGDMAYFWTATEGSASNLAEYFKNLGVLKICSYPTDISRNNGMSVRTIPEPNPDPLCVANWAPSNLATTIYNDGTTIVDGSALSNSAWQALTVGAWRYTNNDPSTLADYGRLYNWYAFMGVYDSASLSNPALRKSIAPSGFKIPEDTDWINLRNCLGGAGAGGKLKEIGTTYWNSPNTGATNSSGFGARGGGYISGIGLPDTTFKTFGWWWSKTSDFPSPSNNSTYAVTATGDSLSSGTAPANFGFGIRVLQI